MAHTIPGDSSRYPFHFPAVPCTSPPVPRTSPIALKIPGTLIPGTPPTCARGFEPPTPWSVAKCSIQLSYAHIFFFPAALLSPAFLLRTAPGHFSLPVQCRRPESNRYCISTTGF